MKSFRIAAVASVVGVALAAGAAHAQVPWVPPSGSGTFFSYTGGLSDNGLFGNPTLIGDTFQFTPSGFVANSVNGSAASTTDRLQVDITANPGHRITMIRVTEFGSWGISGVGSVNAFGSLNLVDQLNLRPPAIAGLSAGTTTPFVSPLPVSTPNTAGLWSGSVVIDLTSIIGPDWTKLRLVFTNTIQATSQQGSASFIDKKVVGGPSIFVEIIPAPSSIALLGLSGLVATRRRR